MFLHIFKNDFNKELIKKELLKKKKKNVGQFVNQNELLNLSDTFKFILLSKCQ